MINIQKARETYIFCFGGDFFPFFKSTSITQGVLWKPTFLRVLFLGGGEACQRQYVLKILMIMNDLMKRGKIRRFTLSYLHLGVTSVVLKLMLFKDTSDARSCEAAQPVHVMSLIMGIVSCLRNCMILGKTYSSGNSHSVSCGKA